MNKFKINYYRKKNRKGGKARVSPASAFVYNQRLKATDKENN